MLQTVHDTSSLTTFNPYLQSTFIEKLKTSLKKHQKARIAFLDVDATLTGHTESLKQVKAYLEKLDYTVCLVTARTEEGVMSKRQYNLSTRFGFSRPKPKLSKTNNQFCYIDPLMCEPQEIIDPDIIAGSTGTAIVLRQFEGGYAKDEDFEKKLPLSSHYFREHVFRIMSYANKDASVVMPAPIEYKGNYEKGISNVAPSDFRVSITFQEMADKKLFLYALGKLKSNESLCKKYKISPTVVEKVRLSTDGHCDRGKYRGYIIPSHGGKTRSADHIISSVCKEVGIERGQIETLFAGDAFPDLKMGLYAGLGTVAKFVLVGGSRMTNYLVKKEHTDFAGEELSEIKKSLRPTKREGYYQFQFGDMLRTVILGDIAFKNTIGPQSLVYAFAEN